MHNIQLSGTINQLRQNALDDDNRHTAFVLKMRGECEALDAICASLEEELYALIGERDDAIFRMERERAENLMRQEQANANLAQQRQSVRQEFIRNELPELVLEAQHVLSAVTGEIIAGWVNRLRNQGIADADPSLNRVRQPLNDQELEQEYEDDC